MLIRSLCVGTSIIVLMACGKKKDSDTTEESANASSLPSQISTGASSTSLLLVEEATAKNDTCMKAFEAVLDGKPKKGDWANGILDHLHDELYRFNSINTADVEMIFCRLADIGVSPDLADLPQTITKEDPHGSTITVTVSVPTESFATDNGYEAKAEVKSGDDVFLTMWWAGSGTSSKGYVIQGANPMQTDGNKRLRYAMWDRTEDTQIVKLMATQFVKGFLKTAGEGKESKTGGDHAVYGHVSFNPDTQEIKTQAIEIRQGNTDATKNSFKCVRTLFNGKLGGTVTGYRPAVGTPEAVTETSTGGTSEIGGSGMDGEADVKDDKDTADHAGTAKSGSDVASGTFDYSCKDINTANASGKFFTDDTVDFTMSPEDVFPK